MSAFAKKMIPPLEELAAQLLPLKSYGRLYLVSELLYVFSVNAWDKIEDSEKLKIVSRLERDFNIRAWDDWEMREDSAYSRIVDLIAAEAKGLRRNLET